MASKSQTFAPVLALFGAGDNPPQGNRFSLLTVLVALLRYRYHVIGAALLVGGVLAFLESRKPHSYTATVQFLLKDGSAAGSGSPGGLLAALGGGGGNSGTGLFLQTLRTRALLADAVTARYTFASGRVRRTPVNVEDSADVKDLLPVRIAGLVLSGNTSTNVESGTGIVNLSVRAADPYLAKQLTDTLLHLLNEANLQRARQRVAIERRFVMERQAQLARELRAAEDEMQSFLTSNRNYQNSPQLIFTHDRLQRAVQLKQSLYSEMATANERARIEEARNTPTLFIWEPSLVPEQPDARTLGGRPFFGAVWVAILVALFGLYREITRRLRGPNVDEMAELAALGRETIGDLRRPWRPIRRSVGRRSAPKDPPAEPLAS
jgi:uncharacterized protein involved in exopolysaccharide biosynthesis